MFTLSKIKIGVSLCIVLTGSVILSSPVMAAKQVENTSCITVTVKNGLTEDGLKIVGTSCDGSAYSKTLSYLNDPEQQDKHSYLRNSNLQLIGTICAIGDCTFYNKNLQADAGTDTSGTIDCSVPGLFQDVQCVYSSGS